MLRKPEIKLPVIADWLINNNKAALVSSHTNVKHIHLIKILFHIANQIQKNCKDRLKSITTLKNILATKMYNMYKRCTIFITRANCLLRAFLKCHCLWLTNVAVNTITHSKALSCPHLKQLRYLFDMPAKDSILNTDQYY